jgi:uncharacterized membrane protein YagU involved in acid resistance
MADIAGARGTRAASIDWSAAIGAGVIGGIVFMMLEMVLAPMFTGAPGIWAPPRMIGAIGLGKEVLPPPGTFHLGAVMVAMMIHFALSIAFGIVTAFIVRNMGMGAAILVGIVLALLLYVFVFYLMTPVWPWFANARNWVSIFVHVVFGAVVAWWYKARAHPAQEHAHARDAA